MSSDTAKRRIGGSTVSETQQPVLVIMGVSGCGKSTVAKLLVDRLGWPFQEGDELHPPSNVAKMHAGTPLTDDDRWPWLDTVADWIHGRIAAGGPGIITCSALRRAYRDRLRRDDRDHVVFVHLAGSREVILGRLDSRRGHFMPPSLLDSQFATLEPPDPDEKAVTVDVARPADEQVAVIIDQLQLHPLTTD